MDAELDLYITNAIAWAHGQLGSQGYALLCLAFVEAAYEKGNGIEVFGASCAADSAALYGVNAGPELPPPGAFVFYDCFGSIKGEYKNWGHVGLSLGNGRVIHAWDRVRVDDYLAVEQLTPAEGWTQPHYVGWTGAERAVQGHRKRGKGGGADAALG